MKACIRRYGGETFCGRSSALDEYLFNDAERAAAIYDERVTKFAGKPSPVCPECIDAWKASGDKEPSNYGGSGIR